jgi:hypothetical protein
MFANAIHRADYPKVMPAEFQGNITVGIIIPGQLQGHFHHVLTKNQSDAGAANFLEFVWFGLQDLLTFEKDATPFDRSAWRQHSEQRRR